MPRSLPTSSKPSCETSNAAEAQAVQAGLVYVSDAEPGISRKRAGKGFAYRQPNGDAVRDAATLQRIRALAVPPAYTEVWICRSSRGHIQATGRDARRRKQYRYHAQWSATRGDGKFDRIVDFGKALPKLRRALRRDLALPGWPRAKVLALVVSVMSETLVRVGNEGYARENRSFGLTTLRNRHAEFLSGGRARFLFKGKGGQEHDIALDDKRLARLVRGVQQLPGQALFQYR
ncbi:MAG: DNA topoisomerase IB, partial [Lysobacteraceae bacterium]